MISIHALREEGDAPGTSPCSIKRYFYPRPPRGGRRVVSGLCLVIKAFLSTPSARRATKSAYDDGVQYGHFYPRPPRGGRQFDPFSGKMFSLISIHALREEGDLAQLADGGRDRHFYPRPPRGGRPYFRGIRSLFLHFYPRPPRGGRHREISSLTRLCRISIHALREEGDAVVRLSIPCDVLFLSTPSARRATVDGILADTVSVFLSTPSARRATVCMVIYSHSKGFLSTPSARRATCRGVPSRSCWRNFYPRPPRGGRQVTKTADGSRRNFYPRPPRGGRLRKEPCQMASTKFLSTPSARRATRRIQLAPEDLQISIHALREEGDLERAPPLAHWAQAFLSTPSARRATMRARLCE